MRIMGHNVLAIFVAAIAIYALEYLIFAVLVPGDAYMRMSGYSAESMEAGIARMPFGVIPPLLAAVGLSLAIKWRNKPGSSRKKLCGNNSPVRRRRTKIWQRN